MSFPSRSNALLTGASAGSKYDEKKEEKKPSWEELEKKRLRRLRREQTRLSLLGPRVKPKTREQEEEELRLRRKLAAHPFMLPSCSPSPQPIKPLPGQKKPEKKSLAVKSTGTRVDQGEFSSFKMPKLVDAETGATLSLTRSRWSCQEGRINLDARSIIEAGTGRMDIFPSVPRPANDVDISVFQGRSDLLTDYLRSGPLNNFFHRYWDPKVDEVVAPQGRINYLAEEGVDFGDSIARPPGSASRTSSRSSSRGRCRSRPTSRPASPLIFTPEPVMEDKAPREEIHIPDILSLTKDDNWSKMEEKLYNELLTMAKSYEETNILPRNRLWTTRNLLFISRLQNPAPMLPWNLYAANLSECV